MKLMSLFLVALSLLGCLAPTESENVEEARDAVTTCLTLRRDLTGTSSVVDSQLADSDMTKNFGASLAFSGGTYYATDNNKSYRYGLIKFDLSSIPTTATVTSADLNLSLRVPYTIPYSSPNTDGTVFAYKALLPWTESTVTWMNFIGPQTWAQFVSNPPSPLPFDLSNPQASVTAQASGHLHMDVLNLVAGWVTDPSGNYGMVLYNNHRGIYNAWTSEITVNGVLGTTLADKPTLIVCYQ